MILSLAPGIIDPLNEGLVIGEDVAPVSTRHSYVFPPIMRQRRCSPSRPFLKGIARRGKVALYSGGSWLSQKESKWSRNCTCQGGLGFPFRLKAGDLLGNGALGGILFSGSKVISPR